MTRKDYILLLEVIRAEFIRSDKSARRALENVVYTLADNFADANPRFDKKRFLAHWADRIGESTR